MTSPEAVRTEPSRSSPRVSVVIPSWDGAALLRAALLSLRRQTLTDFEIIVADNGSRDGTAAMLALEFPDVRVMSLDVNRGFAAAANAGVHAARGEIVALMNNDVEAEPEWLAALVDVLDDRPEVGFVASKMLDARDPRRLDAAWDEMSLGLYNRGTGQWDAPRFNQAREVLTACAGAAAYRRTVFEDVGWFDEDFFAWCEDVELGIRCQLAGYRCWYQPAAVVRHHGSASGARMPEQMRFLQVRNTLILFFQTMPLRRLLPWGPVMLLWPWVEPFISGTPFRICVRAWLGFWRSLPRVLRKHRRIYAERRVPVRDLMARLESPWESVRQALRAVPTGVRTLLGRRYRFSDMKSA